MRVKSLFLLLLAICTVLPGCGKKEQTQQSGQTYILQSISMEGIVMDQEALAEVSGGAELYLKLFSDGTARMRVTSEKVVEMEYDGSYMWRPDTPELKAPYTLEDGILTLEDGAAVYVFEKNP